MLSFLNRRRVPEAPEVEARLAQQGADPELRGPLVGWLLSAPDHEVFRLNPRHLAEQLGQPAHRTLGALAPALTAGVVDLSWETRCPACGGTCPAFASLATAHRQQTCPMCQNSYEARLDDEVRVTFSISATLRRLGPAADDPAWRARVDQRLGPVTGHDLLTVQAFRDLFVREPMPGGESFDVRRMSLMFTDLGGSTAIYARKGDPRAYGLVREHFGLLQQSVDAAGGAVVKTIGDAVMAVFTTADAALAAAIASQRAVAAFNAERQLAADEALGLKVGIHSGPCLAVTLNQRLDYFGTTVNAAARVEKLARPGEIALTADSRGELADPAVLTPLLASEEQATLRGLEDRPFTVVRLRVIDAGETL